jgi:hypothetical protein
MAGYEESIKAIRARGWAVVWNQWGLQAIPPGGDATQVVSKAWPCGPQGPCDADIAIRDRVAGELLHEITLAAVCLEYYEAVVRALEFLDNGTPIHPGSLLHEELRQAFDKVSR